MHRLLVGRQLVTDYDRLTVFVSHCLCGVTVRRVPALSSLLHISAFRSPPFDKIYFFPSLSIMATPTTTIDKTHHYLACTAEQLAATLKTVQKLYEADDNVTWKHHMLEGVTDCYSVRPAGTKADVRILVDDHHMGSITTNNFGQVFPLSYTSDNHVIFVTKTVEALLKAVPQFDPNTTDESVPEHYVLWSVVDADHGRVVHV
jgi:hypothetical protein